MKKENDILYASSVTVYTRNRKFLLVECHFLLNFECTILEIFVRIWKWSGQNVKCTLVQALRLCTGRTAHRGSGGIALLFLDHGTRRGSGVSVTPRPLFIPWKTCYPLYRRLGDPQGRSGQVRKISPPPGFDPRTVQPVASRYADCTTQLT